MPNKGLNFKKKDSMRTSLKSIPKVSFALPNAANAKGKKCIYARVFVCGRYLKKSTDIWIDPSEWDSSEERVNTKSKNKGLINARLSMISDSIVSKMYAIPNRITYKDVYVILNGRPSKHEEMDWKDTNFIEYARKYNDLMYGKNKYGYSTWSTKMMQISMFEKYILNNLKLPHLLFGDLKVSIFDQYINYKLTVKRCKSKEGINNCLHPLYDPLKYALENNEINAGIVGPIIRNTLSIRETKYKPEFINTRKVRYLRGEELEKLHQYWIGHKDYSYNALEMFFFSYYVCGLRASDIITLEWDNIDFERKVIRKVMVKSKRMLDVELPISDNAMAILERRLALPKRNKRFVFNQLPEDIDLDNPQFFYLRKYTRQSVINKSLIRIGKKAGMPIRLTFHVARHSFAVTAINKGVSIYTLSKLMGHATVSTTETVYADLLKETVANEVTKVFG